ncbi:MAG: thioredoxin [Candidatus Zhuqueibacterota bacterium]|jgi:thioredoxin 1
MSNLVTITEANFESEVIKSDTPVLIDFWAVWCGPCKMIAPIVEELSKDYDGKVKMAKCDVDRNQSVAIKYGIRSIPTLLIFKGGKVVEQIVGAVPKQNIKSKLDKVLGN